MEWQKTNWLDVWNTETDNDLKSDSGVCYVAGSVKTNGTTYCDGCTLGDHMASTLGAVHPQRNDYIYIIPICKSHNNVYNEAEMKICSDVDAVKMNRFTE